MVRLWHDMNKRREKLNSTPKLFCRYFRLIKLKSSSGNNSNGRPRPEKTSGATAVGNDGKIY